VENAFKQHLGASIPRSEDEFRELLRERKLHYGEDEEWETLFYRAFIEVERHLGWEKPAFLKDFPEELCALARIIKGVELANGWTEETNESEIERRLRKESERRQLPLDPEFVKAHGQLPPCAGCSVGLDRLFMLLAGKSSLEELKFF